MDGVKGQRDGIRELKEESNTRERQDEADTLGSQLYMGDDSQGEKSGGRRKRLPGRSELGPGQRATENSDEQLHWPEGQEGLAWHESRGCP